MAHDDPNDNDDRDALPTPAERALAGALGDRVDELLRGQARPPAMQAEERSLLEMATVIRAGARPDADGTALDVARGQAMIDQALSPAPAPRRAESEGPAAPDQLASRRLRRAVPWVAAAVSAAAAVIMAFQPAPVPAPGRAEAPRAARLSDAARSRPTDALVGRIAASEAHMASERIDTIFADRLRGYRAVRLARAGQP